MAALDNFCWNEQTWLQRRAKIWYANVVVAEVGHACLLAKFLTNHWNGL